MKSLLLAILLGLNTAQAELSPALEAYGEIDSQRSSVDISISNSSGTALLCSEININVVYENPGQMVLSQKNYKLMNIYIEGGAILNKKIGQEEYQKLSSKYQYVFIRDFKINISEMGCKAPTFVDYCRSMAKSSDEAYTLQRILEATSSSQCEDVEPNLVKQRRKLKLRASGISNLKPFVYLNTVVDLDLSENKITSVQDLSKSVSLVKLNLSKNPLSDIQAILRLPRLKSVNMAGTSYEAQTK